MRIASFRHRDLERFWRRDEARGVARQHEAKLRAMLTALEEAENVVELETIQAGGFIHLKEIEKALGA
jgi:plasmid maintenance system killer protein